MSVPRRILVTGARGMLGTDLCAVLKDAGHEVIPADIQEFDITDGPSTLAFRREHRPTVIINCAAYTAVDQAESEPEIAFGVNRDGARNLAEALRSIGGDIVHVSTDYVFDGTKDAVLSRNSSASQSPGTPHAVVFSALVDTPGLGRAQRMKKSTERGLDWVGTSLGILPHRRCLPAQKCQ